MRILLSQVQAEVTARHGWMRLDGYSRPYEAREISEGRFRFEIPSNQCRRAVSHGGAHEDFPGDVGNGSRIEAWQEAIRVLSGYPIVSGAPRDLPSGFT